MRLLQSRADVARHHMPGHHRLPPPPRPPPKNNGVRVCKSHLRVQCLGRQPVHGPRVVHDVLVVVLARGQARQLQVKVA